jgi:hypothetical protein
MIGSRAKTRKGIVAEKEGADGFGEESDGNCDEEGGMESPLRPS